MTGIKRATIAVLSTLVFYSSAHAQKAEVPVTLPDTSYSVTVSDFHGFLDGVGLIAAKVNPQINGMMLKMILGMQLGDPGLAGIAAGKGLAIVSPDSTNMYAVIEVSEAQAPMYANLVTSQGMQSAYTNDVLVVGQTVELLEEGIKNTADVKSLLLANRSPSLRVVTSPSALMKENEGLIQGYLESLPALIQTSIMMEEGAETNAAVMASKVLEGELALLVSLTEQCETAEIELLPSEGALRINETLVPEAGTPLAKLLSAPKTAKPNARIQSGLLGEGMFRSDMVIGNPDAFIEFFSVELEKMIAVMDLKDVDSKESVETSKKWLGVCAGATGEMFSMDSESGIENAKLMEVADEAATLELYKTMSEDLKGFLNLYEALGMPVAIEFKENIRAHKEIQIHEFLMKIDVSEMPAEQKEQFAAMNLDNMRYELALFDGMALFYTGDEKIETLIDRIQDTSIKPEALEARSLYPDGGFFYMDFNTAQYLEMIAGFIPAEQQGSTMPQLIALMQGADPVTMAGFSGNGVVKWSVNFPGDLLAKIGTIAMMQASPQPAGAPVQ